MSLSNPPDMIFVVQVPVYGSHLAFLPGLLCFKLEEGFPRHHVSQLVSSEY